MKLRSQTRREQASQARAVVSTRIRKSEQSSSSDSPPGRVAKKVGRAESSNFDRSSEPPNDSSKRHHSNCPTQVKKKIAHLKNKLLQKTKLIARLQKEQQETINGLTEIKTKLRSHFAKATKNIESLRELISGYEVKAAQYDAILENKAEAEALIDIGRGAPEQDHHLADSMKCIVCLGIYREGKWPILGRCGHSACESCIPQLRNCPACRNEGAFQDNNKNFLAIDIINAVRQRQTEARS